MITVEKESVYSWEIEKSNFIGYIAHVESTDDFKNILKEVKNKYPKATHYCYAYNINGQQKSNDDGEPSSTAGRPILEAIIQNELENVAIIVIRYFGGIKLGAGGLTRAYLKTALDTVKTAEIIEYVNLPKYEIEIDYTFNDIVYNNIKKNRGIYVLDTKYEIKVQYIVATETDLDFLIDICNGKIAIEKIGFETLKMKPEAI